MWTALRAHWPEYLMEAALLGGFMISACAFAALLYHPGSPVAAQVPDAFARGALMGLAMGGTAVALVYSPWGKQSGAHMNPAMTLNFWRLGKIAPWDAAFYVAAQCGGGIAGVLAIRLLLGPAIADPSVNYVLTLPGAYGEAAAFFAEIAISGLMMLMVLTTANTPRLAPYTGWFAGLLVCLYIMFEAPLSGMSINPARSLGSAAAANQWTAFWIYVVAPPLGMYLATIVYGRVRGLHTVMCAKLHHQNEKRCIFCEYQRPTARRESLRAPAAD